MNPSDQHLTPKDIRIINIREAWDLNFWCEELNLRADELKFIVKHVGPRVHDVKLHLTKKLLIDNYSVKTFNA
jgi:hypothetical protein